jgi:hypothetical protein
MSDKYSAQVFQGEIDEEEEEVQPQKEETVSKQVTGSSYSFYLIGILFRRE